MAKKNATPNQSNLLSERMKKTKHSNNSGTHSQQTEINIFVDQNSEETPVINNSQYTQQSQQQSVYSEDIYMPPQDTTDNSFINGESFNPDTYVSPYQSDKKKKQKPQKTIKNIEENAISGENGNPFEKKKIPKKIKLIVILSIVFAILISPQIIFRVPPLFSDEKEVIAKVVDNKKTIDDFITTQNGTEDWDNDGITNNSDKAVWDPDTDKNGIPDGETTKTFIKENTTIQYENVTLQIKNQKVGISKFLNYYIFNNFEGWAKFENENGTPYIYQKNGWQQAEYKKQSGNYFVYIPNDCRIEFVEGDVINVYRTDLFGDRAFANKSSRYVTEKGMFAKIEAGLLKLILPITEPTPTTVASIWYTTDYHLIAEKNIKVASAVKPSTESYDLSTLKNYEFSYDKLQKIYDDIDRGETTLISIITSKGEAICFAYGYDYLGNIYIADAQTSKALGKINIKPTSQTYYKGDNIYIREWYEFEGLGFSSEQGDNLFIY